MSPPLFPGLYFITGAVFRNAYLEIGAKHWVHGLCSMGIGLLGILVFTVSDPVLLQDGMVTDQPDLTDDLYENATLHSETGAWQMIFGVVTRPEYRKHGLAAQLLNRAIADARQQGRKGLVLTCKDKLVHYYAKFGFVNEGVSQSTHGNVAWNQMRLTF